MELDEGKCDYDQSVRACLTEFASLGWPQSLIIMEKPHILILLFPSPSFSFNTIIIDLG